MKKTLIAFLLFTHLLVGLVGVGAGIYILPILIAPQAPTAIQISDSSAQAQFRTQFTRNLQDSDALHWGEGSLYIGSNVIAFAGSLAPGPDYKLYLAKEFIETEAKFRQLKPQLVRVGDVKTFDNFMVTVTSDIDVSQYNTVIIWCETFGEFITAAKYQ